MLILKNRGTDLYFWAKAENAKHEGDNESQSQDQQQHDANGIQHQQEQRLSSIEQHSGETGEQPQQQQRLLTTEWPGDNGRSEEMVEESGVNNDVENDNQSMDETFYSCKSDYTEQEECDSEREAEEQGENHRPMLHKHIEEDAKMGNNNDNNMNSMENATANAHATSEDTSRQSTGVVIVDVHAGSATFTNNSSSGNEAPL